ncbi:NAD(P)-binding protein [Melanomma pulvis-pyrius CBS 109.77]|uniref:NAD(P)-binding protein n=1 Tax=Melanomma pulvis-pyrius CBS 109.77 TaxID=1314802 RepID=A0A6A6XL01_9PLEO|nr:NAD(P)-binding protein [Melanomma pulvis-pyrius CBS 109.77]
MSDTPSKSIYLGPDGKLDVQEVTETYTPQGSQSLVRVRYSGINPCDFNFFYVGLHSFITGFDFSGTVVETGPASPFKVGDTVCGLSKVAFPQPSSAGTHQDLAITEANLTYTVPPGIELKDAGAIALVSQTAIDALFNGLGFGLPVANLSGIDPKNQSILIWGGASSVGIAAIQIAKAAGFHPIFTTASPKNHATLERYGATLSFDYKSPSVVDEIRAAAKAQGVTLTTVLDTVGHGLTIPGVAPELTSPALARSALSNVSDAHELKLVCTLPVRNDPAFKFCTSYRPSGSTDAMGGPQDPEAPTRIRKAMEYFLASYETVVKLPNITVVMGASAGIGGIEKVARGNVSMEKVVIAHPM